MSINLDEFFFFMNGFAGLGWLFIIFISQNWKRYDMVVIGIIAVILAITYTTFNVTNFRSDILQKFSTLDGVMILFSQKPFVMACWAHILCFDLVVGFWIKKNSLKHGINHWVLLPSFIFTIMLGPLGFLIYYITRLIKTGKYFASN
jgi:hypothetical protein